MDARTIKAASQGSYPSKDEDLTFRNRTLTFTASQLSPRHDPPRRLERESRNLDRPTSPSNHQGTKGQVFGHRHNFRLAPNLILELVSSLSSLPTTSSSLLSPRMASFARDILLPRSLHCRTVFPFLRRQLWFYAGRFLLALAMFAWTGSREVAGMVLRKDVLVFVLYCFTLFILFRLFKLKQQFDITCSSAIFSVFPTANPVSYVLGTNLGFTIGMEWFWLGKWEKYQKLGADVICIRSLFSSVPEFTVANAGAIKKISMDRTTYKKPTAMYSMLKFFGNNMVTTEDEEWKRHRKVASPSFHQKAYPLVWERTSSIINNMMCHEGWNDLKSGESFTINHVHNLTTKVALVVIAEAGFGLRMDWAEHIKGQPTPGSQLKGEAEHAASLARWGGWFWKREEMSVQQSLRIVATNAILRAVLPKIFFWIPSTHLWAVDRAFGNLDVHLGNIVSTRRHLISSGTDYEEVEIDDGFDTGDRDVERVQKVDLFGALIKSALDCEAGPASGRLNDREVIGNLFIFLLAGHETTANSLAFTFANLALNPRCQDKMLEEILAVCGEEEPTFENYGQLRYTLACYNESIRLFPPVNIIPKVAVLGGWLRHYHHHEGVLKDVWIPIGSKIMLDVVGLHYNPHYWTDPHAYIPERFLNISADQKDAFFPFAGGPRACIGRRFTEVESVCAMAKFVRSYRILPGDGTGESLLSLQRRLLQAKQVITLTPVDCPITFQRR